MCVCVYACVCAGSDESSGRILEWNYCLARRCKVYACIYISIHSSVYVCIRIDRDIDIDMHIVIFSDFF